MTTRASVQITHLRLEGITDDALGLGTGQRRAVLEVRGVPFSLLGEREREALVVGYAGFLNALAYPVQVLVRALPLDLDGYLAPLESRARTPLPRGLAALAHDHASFLRRLARQQALLERHHYVVIPADEPPRRRLPIWPLGHARSAVAPDGVVQRLSARCDEVRAGLSRCGLDAHRLTNGELAELVYACWCPERARDQRLRAERLEYDGLAARPRRLPERNP